MGNWCGKYIHEETRIKLYAQYLVFGSQSAVFTFTRTNSAAHVCTHWLALHHTSLVSIMLGFAIFSFLQGHLPQDVQISIYIHLKKIFTVQNKQRSCLFPRLSGFPFVSPSLAPSLLKATRPRVYIINWPPFSASSGTWFSFIKSITDGRGTCLLREHCAFSPPPAYWPNQSRRA